MKNPILVIITIIVIPVFFFGCIYYSVGNSRLLESFMQEEDFKKLLDIRDKLFNIGITESNIDWLRKQLNNNEYIGLENTADLIIPRRMNKLKFHGHGLLCKHDLFTVNGRAQWLLKVVETNNTDEQWEAYKVE